MIPWVSSTKEVPFLPRTVTAARTLLCHELPPEFYAERDALEADFLIHKDAKAAAEADRAFYERWSAEKLKKVPTSYQFRNRWAKKTKVLKDETK